MMTKWYFSFFSLFLLLNCIHLHGQCLSLKEAIQIAIDQNPANRAAAYGIVVAHEQVGIERSHYYPTVDAYFSYSRWQRHIFLPKFPKIQGFNFQIPSIVGPTNDWSLGVRSQYLIYDSGRRRAQLEIAKAQRGIALYDALRIEQEIALNTATAFYSLLANLEIEDVAKRQADRTEHHLLIAKQRKSAGDVPLLDVYQAEVQAANAKQAVIQATSQVQISKGALNIGMGLPPDTCIEICKDLSPINPVRDDILCGAFEQAAANRAELLAAKQRLDAFQSQIQAAKSEFGPKVTAEGHYGWEDSNFFPSDKSWLIGVNAEWRLFDGFGRVHGLRKARAELNQQLQEYNRISLQVQQDVWNSFQQLKQSFAALDSIRLQIQSAKESLRLSEARYRAGAGTLSDLLDAQTALTSAEANYVEAQWNYLTALATFKWSQGLCL